MVALVRRPSQLLGMAAVAGGLGGCSTTQDPVPVEPCTVVQGAADPSSDLVLSGGGACDATVRLSLRIATGTPEQPAWSPAAGSTVAVDGDWLPEGGGVVRDVTLRNSGSEAVTVVGLEWSTEPGQLRFGPDRMLHNGYQSWSYSGLEAIPAVLADTGGTAPHGGDNEDVLGETEGVSWWWTFLAAPSGVGLVAGADGGTVFKTYLAADGAPAPRLRIVQGLTGDSVVLAPGETKPLDGLFVQLGSVAELLEAYAERVAARHPPAVPRSGALGGWGSWNLYYEDVDAPTLGDEIAWAADHLVPAGLTDFLLDDGYMPHWGQWVAAPEFGADLATFAQAQVAAGLRPAIWLAPLYVHVDDPLVTDHPDWFVHYPNGELRTYSSFGPEYAALDATSPDARQLVTTAIEDLRSWGYVTFKFDYLLGGALEGLRQQPSTSLESYQLWLRTIREAAGDSHLIGCGAPLLPSVGWVDSLRTGPDIAFTLSPEPRYNLLSAQARHTAVRGFTDRWWSLDPDVVLLRGDGINDVEAWTHVISAALAGGSYLLGDGRQSSGLRQALALAPEVIAIARDGVAARPLDPVARVDAELFANPMLMGAKTTAVPHLWHKQSADGTRSYLAVFAWEVEGFSAEVELPDGATELVPPAQAGEAIVSQPISAGRIAVAVPYHGVRLFTWPS